MRREHVLGLALAAAGGALLALGTQPQRGAIAGLLLVAGAAAAVSARPWTKRLGVAGVVAGLALAPHGGSLVAMTLGTLAALFGLGAILFGIHRSAWVPAALVAAVAAVVAFAPALLAPGLADATSPVFLLVCAGLVGMPCAAIALLRRQHHLEVVK